MNVGAICTRKVSTIKPSESLVEAAGRMREAHVGDLVVVADDGGGRTRPLGILTDRDIVIGVIAKVPEHVPILSVGDVLLPELVTAREDEDVDEVLRRMRSRAVRRVPVVDGDDNLVGILSLDDVLDVLAGEVSLVAEIVSRQRRNEAARRPP